MMHEIVKRGDTVVILPMWQIPRLSVQDEQGRYLAGGIVVRRGEGESIGVSIEMQERQK